MHKVQENLKLQKNVPDTIEYPKSVKALAIALAFFRTCVWYSLNIGVCAWKING